MFLDCGSLIATHHLVGLNAVDIGGDHHRQIARHFFGMFAHLGHDSRYVAGAAADFLRKIPSCKRFVVTIFLPNFIDKREVDIYLFLIFADVPEISRVINAEIKFHVVFVCKREEHLYQIERRIHNVVAAGHNRLKRSCNPTAETGTDKNNGVDAHFLH